ncbi:MAG: hypothetical protein KF714_05910 [Parvibaculum sp.]|nr:hypothetical protein [Parvibaculum sp.]
MTLRTLALAAIFILAASASRAETIEFEAPDSTERFIVELPKGWGEVHHKKSGSGDAVQEMWEFLAKGQTTTNWDEMITVIIARSGNPGPQAHEDIARLTIEMFGQLFCKNLFGDASIHSGVRNGFPVAIYNVSCFTNPDAPSIPGVYSREFEMLSGLVIIGENSIYQLQRAWHTDEFEIDPKTGMAMDGYNALKKIAEFSQLTTSYVGSSTWPCNPARSDRPCTAPPLVGQ